MLIRTTILGLAALLALSAAIACLVFFTDPVVVYGSWAATGLLAIAWLVFNRGLVASFLRKKSTRYGANISLVIFLVLGILVFLNVLGKQYSWRKDLTRSGLNSLSPQTVKVLRELPQDVAATFFTSMQEKDKGEAVLKSFAHSSGRFKYEFVDVLRSPTRAQAMGVKKIDTVFLAFAGKPEKSIKVEGVSEEGLVNGLMKLLRAQDKKVYFTTGHGEHALEAGEQYSYAELKGELDKQGYATGELNLLTEGKIPADAAVLVVGGPRKAFFPKELELLSAWLAGGGRLFLTTDLDVAESGLAKGSRQVADLLKPFGVEVKNQMLVDPTSQLANVEPTVLLGFASEAPHVITRDFPRKATAANFLFPLTSYLTHEERPGLTVSRLANTSTQAWAEADWSSLKSGRVTFDRSSGDFQGQMDLAYAIEAKPPEGEAAAKPRLRLVVFANGMFATDGLLDKAGNRDLALNSLAWLLDDEGFISIRAKQDQDNLRQYSNTAMNVILIVTVFLVPFLALLAGLRVWWRRSKL